MQDDSKFVSGFVGSILVHLAIIILAALLPTPKLPDAPLKFDIIESPQKTANSLPVIRSSQLPDNQVSQTEKDHLRFFSEKTQHVKEQLRAQRSGLTKNRSQKSADSQPKQEKSSSEISASKELDMKGFEKFLPKKIAIPTARQAMHTQERGFSTISEDLPSEIQVGEITSVDTDHYLFYSYFSRAQELLWNEWAPMVQSVLNRPPPSIRANSQNRFTTILEAWFLPGGQVHSIHLLKPSGIPELDYVASSSFKRVGIIPNPPREKIDPDGLIRFKWSLTVEYDPKVLVRQ